MYNFYLPLIGLMTGFCCCISFWFSSFNYLCIGRRIRSRSISVLSINSLSVVTVLFSPHGNPTMLVFASFFSYPSCYSYCVCLLVFFVVLQWCGCVLGLCYFLLFVLLLLLVPLYRTILSSFARYYDIFRAYGNINYIRLLLFCSGLDNFPSF